MASLLQYKCPSCGGNIEFDSGIQKPKCPYCDTEFELADLAAYDEELKGDKADNINWQSKNEQWAENEMGEDGMKVFVCESCGGEVVTEQTTAAMKCPWCDNPIVVKGSVAGSLRPDFVIPFKLDKAQAKEGYLKHLMGKKFLPSVFRDENHIDEIKGIYVPFWLFDANVDANFRFRALTKNSWVAGDYMITETRHYALIRRGEMKFDNIPEDASLKMADDLMESVEPFNYEEMVDFQTAYLSGYLADKYDVSVEDTIERANARIRKTAENAMYRTTGGYMNVIKQNGTVNIEKGEVSYALLPLWILNTTWNGQKYTFAMNGQTGKFVGNLPLDKAAKRKYFWSRFGIIAGIAIAVIALFLGFFGSY